MGKRCKHKDITYKRKKHNCQVMAVRFGNDYDLFILLKPMGNHDSINIQDHDITINGSIEYIYVTESNETGWLE
jgi:hypothetical protein